MKTSHRPSHGVRTDAARRAQLLATFDQSGLSAAAFARQHGLHYTTFCGWCHRRAKRPSPPAFVQVELDPPSAAEGLIIELESGARLRVESSRQIALAAQLLQTLHASRPC
jgi:hypothetical protein